MLSRLLIFAWCAASAAALVDGSRGPRAPTTTTTTKVATLAPPIKQQATLPCLASREFGPLQNRFGRNPVVILHGLLGQKRNFRSWAAALAEALKHKRRVLTLDLRFAAWDIETSASLPDAFEEVDAPSGRPFC